MTSTSDALTAFAAANPVQDPALLPLPYPDATALVEAYRPRPAPAPQPTSARLGGGIRRAIMVLLAVAFAGAAMAAVAVGVWSLVRQDGTAAAPDTSLTPTTVAPTTAAPTTTTTTRPPPTTTTTLPPLVIQPTRIVAAGSTYDGSFPAVALNPDGNPVIAHLDDGGASIRLAVCGDPGCVTLAGATTIPIEDWTEPHDVIVGADEIPLLAYVDVDVDGAPIVRLARCADPICNDHTITDLGPGNAPSLAIGSDGLPIVAFGNSLEEAAVIARCTDTACAGEFDTTVVESIRWRLGPLALIGDDIPLIAQVTVQRDGDSVLRVAVCSDAECGDIDTADLGAVPPDAVVVGIVVDPVGLATIFVADPGSEILAFRCLEPACSTAIEPVSVGGHRSLGELIGTAWGVEGPVLVSTNAGPSLAPTNPGWLFRCDDAECRTGTIVELPGLQGAAASLVVDDAGEPVVFFHRPRSGAFVLRCERPDCGEIPAATEIPWTPETVAASFEGLGPVMEGWRRAVLPRDEGGGGVVAVARLAELLVAIGHDCEFLDGIAECRPMAWVTDDPAVWEPVRVPPGGNDPLEADEALIDIVATGSGFVASGIECTESDEGRSCASALWISEDGDDWSPAETPPGGSNACGPDDDPACTPAALQLIWGDGVLLALGTATAEPLAWWSLDGRVWTAAPIPSPTDQTWLIDAVVTPDGFLAFGGTCTTTDTGEITDLRCSTVVWDSSSGRRWVTRDQIPAFDNSLVADLGPAHGGFFAAGESCDDAWRCRPSVWWSTDTLEWDLLPEVEAFDDVIEASTLTPWGPVGLAPSLDRILVVATAIDTQRGLERGVFLVGSYQGASSWRRLIGDEETFGTGRLGITELVPLADVNGMARFIAVGADRLGPAVWVWDRPVEEDQDEA